MRDLTSTKREFTTLARRLYRRGPLSVNGAFRGVIGRGFGIWIRQHWGIANSGLFRPVEREFQTQQKPFALLSWPQSTRAGETNYNFSTTLRLSCFPQQTNNSLFELDATGIFQTLTLKQPAGAREESIRNVFVERALPAKPLNWLSSLSNLRVLCASVVTFLKNIEPQRHREHRGFTEKREYRFLERIFHTFDRESNSRRHSTRLYEFLSAPSRYNERSLRSEMRRFNSTTSFRRDFALPSSSLSTPIRLQSTTNLHTRLDHQFLTSAKNIRAERNSHFGTNVFTTLALNFAAPKVSEMDLVAQRISQFVSSPELIHIHRQQAISQEVINALRAQRTPYVEPKPVPMPVMPSIEQLTDQVRTQLERDLRIERERRGL